MHMQLLLKYSSCWANIIFFNGLAVARFMAPEMVSALPTSVVLVGPDGGTGEYAMINSTDGCIVHHYASSILYKWCRLISGAFNIARLRRLWAMLGHHLRVIKSRGRDESAN